MQPTTTALDEAPAGAERLVRRELLLLKLESDRRRAGSGRRPVTLLRRPARTAARPDAAPGA